MFVFYLVNTAISNTSSQVSSHWFKRPPTRTYNLNSLALHVTKGENFYSTIGSTNLDFFNHTQQILLALPQGNKPRSNISLNLNVNIASPPLPSPLEVKWPESFFLELLSFIMCRIEWWEDKTGPSPDGSFPKPRKV